MSLAKLIAKKLSQSGLTPAQGAAKANITAITFKAVLAGKSVPNKRSLAKYAKFLGLSTRETTKLAGNRAKKGKKAAVKAVKKAGKRGRPPGKAKKAGKSATKSGKKSGVAPGKLKAISKQIARAHKVLVKLAATVAKLG